MSDKICYVNLRIISFIFFMQLIFTNPLLYY